MLDISHHSGMKTSNCNVITYVFIERCLWFFRLHTTAKAVSEAEYTGYGSRKPSEEIKVIHRHTEYKSWLFTGLKIPHWKKASVAIALHRVGSLENVYHMRILKSECWCVSNINCLFMKSWKYYLCSIDSLRLQSWHVQACTENAFLTEIADTKCVLIYRHCIVQWAVQPQQLTILLTNAQHTVVARL